MEIIDRIKSPTPAFHKKLQKIALAAIAIAGSIIGGLAAVPEGVDLAVPPMLIQGCWYVIAIGGAIAGTGQTAKE